jgi:hypothetical protein
MTQALDLLNWRKRLAGDRRVVAFTEEGRYGVLFVVAMCKNRRAARGLLKALQAKGCSGRLLSGAECHVRETEVRGVGKGIRDGSRERADGLGEHWE